MNAPSLWAPWTGDNVTYHLMEAPGSKHAACCAVYTFDAYGTVDGDRVIGPTVLPDQAVTLADLPKGKLACGVCVGISHARHEAALRAAIAYETRAELVCCHIYDDLAEARATLPDKDFHRVLAIGRHEICYWGEAGARIAEGRDDADLADVPYVDVPPDGQSVSDLPADVRRRVYNVINADPEYSGCPSEMTERVLAALNDDTPEEPRT